MRFVLVLAFFSMLLEGSGETIYKKKCASCHQGYLPMGKLKENFVEYNNTKLRLKAPTINQLSFRLKQKIGDPSGDREMQLLEIEAFVKSYIYHPDKSRSICMREVQEVFATMPSMKGKISEDEISEVVAYIYDFDQKGSLEQMQKPEAFEDALKRAKKEHKVVMIKAESTYCHYCKKMDKEVLSSPGIKKLLQKHFIPVTIDVYKEKLPLGLKYKFTPTFFFIDSDGKVLKVVPGAYSKEDFIELLKEIKP